MPGSAAIRHAFQNVQKRCYDTAQRRLSEQLPYIMDMAREYARNHQQGDFGDMTGNWLNSFGVAIYREGRPVAIANMSSADVDAPIRTTLIHGDIFDAGMQRYDETFQLNDFEPEEGTEEQVFYNEEVVSWLSRTWTKSKGFSFRVVTVAEYHIDTARRVLLQLSNEMEARGGYIWQFNLG